MKVQLKSICVLELESSEGAKTSKHISTNFNLDVSKNMDRSKYFDKDGLPNAEGSKALTQVFMAGLIANIHNAHNNKFRDSAEHLRYIISELERGFIQVAYSEKSIFPEDK